MNGLQIDSLLKELKEVQGWYQGTFVAANIPFSLIRKNNIFFICNTVSDITIMGHWILIFIYKNELYYFDSYGENPPNNNILKFYNNYPGKKHKVTSYSLQSNHSYVCGAYCILVAVHKCRGVSFKTILKKFNKFNKISNDRVVLKFLSKLKKSM